MTFLSLTFLCCNNIKKYCLSSAHYVPSTMLDTLRTLSLVFIISLLNVRADFQDYKTMAQNLAE